MKKGAKIIRENSEQAAEFLKQYETKYLSAVRSVSTALKNLGISPTKALVLSAIKKDFEEITDLYRDVVLQDENLFKTAQARAMVQRTFTQSIEGFKESVRQWFAGEIASDDIAVRNYTTFEILTKKGTEKRGYVPMKSLSLFKFIEFDENGYPFLSDENKEEIVSAFRDYADDMDDKLMKKQAEAAKALHDFFSTLAGTGVSVDFFFLTPTLCRYFTFEDSDNKPKITPNPEGLLNLDRLRKVVEDCCFSFLKAKGLFFNK